MIHNFWTSTHRGEASPSGSATGLHLCHMSSAGQSSLSMIFAVFNVLKFRFKIVNISFLLLYSAAL